MLQTNLRCTRHKQQDPHCGIDKREKVFEMMINLLEICEGVSHE